jgi:8-oxo-dGTP diphosphatase
MSDTGARFWGRHGAAGLLLRAPLPSGVPAVLLQHRAPWSHQGSTWGLPGGARDSHETPEQTAVREAHEETGLAVEKVVVRAAVVTARASGSHWTYTTVVADAPHLLQTVPNMESAEVRWVLEEEVDELPLHPGFAASWRRLRTAVVGVPKQPGLPRTVELESGEFVWCTPAGPGDARSPLSDRINSLLQAPR